MYKKFKHILYRKYFVKSAFCAKDTYPVLRQTLPLYYSTWFLTLVPQDISYYNINCCITTRGSDGVSVVEKNKNFHLNANAREVFDVSGAGDTFIACFASAIVGGSSINEAADFANSAAGIVVGHIGTAAIKKDELL